MVEEIYNTVVEKYPTPSLLAKADPYELKSILRPLGLIYRAERLAAVSCVISQEYCGKVPSRISELLKLPGVGNYIARAVACFAYGQKYLPWDTNMVRISKRVFGLQSLMSRPRMDIGLADYLGSFLLSEGDVKVIVWAVLDFASGICTARNPKCDYCFALKYCHFKKCSTQHRGS